MVVLLLDLFLPFVALTWLFTESDGPWGIFLRLRTRAGVESAAPGFFGKLLSCGGCTAAWAGAAVGLVQVFPRILESVGVVWWYPEWLAWLVRCPLAAVGLIVVLDMFKPYPPLDLSALAELGGTDAEEAQGAETDAK